MRRKKEVTVTRALFHARRYAERAGHKNLPKFKRQLTTDSGQEVYSAVCPDCGVEVKVEHYDIMMGDRSQRGWEVNTSVFQRCRKKVVLVRERDLLPDKPHLDLPGKDSFPQVHIFPRLPA